MAQQPVKAAVRRRKPPEPKKETSRRQIDVEVPEAKIKVRRTAYGQEHEREEEIEVPAFHGPVGYVRVGGSVTKNLGDYNSARVEVSVSLPTYPTPQEIERTYRFGSQLVDQYVSRELDIATGEINPED